MEILHSDHPDVPAGSIHIEVFVAGKRDEVVEAVSKTMPSNENRLVKVVGVPMPESEVMDLAEAAVDAERAAGRQAAVTYDVRSGAVEVVPILAPLVLEDLYCAPGTKNKGRLEGGRRLSFAGDNGNCSEYEDCTAGIPAYWNGKEGILSSGHCPGNLDLATDSKAELRYACDATLMWASLRVRLIEHNDNHDVSSSVRPSRSAPMLSHIAEAEMSISAAIRIARTSPVVAGAMLIASCSSPGTVTLPATTTTSTQNPAMVVNEGERWELVYASIDGEVVAYPEGSRLPVFVVDEGGSATLEGSCNDIMLTPNADPAMVYEAGGATEAYCSGRGLLDLALADGIARAESLAVEDNVLRFVGHGLDIRFVLLD